MTVPHSMMTHSNSSRTALLCICCLGMIISSTPSIPSHSCLGDKLHVILFITCTLELTMVILFITFSKLHPYLLIPRALRSVYHVLKNMVLTAVVCCPPLRFSGDALLGLAVSHGASAELQSLCCPVTVEPPLLSV